MDSTLMSYQFSRISAPDGPLLEKSGIRVNNCLLDGWMTCDFTSFFFLQYFSHIRMMGG